uniref:Ribonuclease H-like domain-containing protein n=1 Tax=Tanacetum cinerariifolium TaxID=118510 RepID=A0A6L2LYX1_TANCI|nr:ribonuclease H-like domain-containing protein [Tanacetum cinerariifolium]
MTYLKEVEETLGTPIEVEPLDETQLEDLGLNTCNHDLPLSSREVSRFDEPKPQPQPLPNYPPLGHAKRTSVQPRWENDPGRLGAALKLLNVIQIVLWYLDSDCSKHMTGDRSELTNFVNKFLEGLGHNLFSVGQSCDSNLEVAFRQHTCFIRNLEDTVSFKVFKLKFEKDHLCSACEMGKSKKKPHKHKSKDTNQEKLYLLHMDLCGPMRVASVNGKKYILVTVDDYSRFTWVKCLRLKDEAPDFIIKFVTPSFHISAEGSFEVLRHNTITQA